MLSHLYLYAFLSIYIASPNPNETCHPHVVAEQPEKPSYCRTDLAGCCPRDIKHVLLLHTPKTAGTAVRRWLERVTWRLLPTVTASSENSTIETADDYRCRCSALTRLASTGRFFGSSNFVAMHGDRHIVTLLERLAPTELEHTVIIVTAREPLQRALSLYHHFKTSPGKQHFPGNSLEAYLASGRVAARPFSMHNYFTRMLGSTDICSEHCGLGKSRVEDDCATWQAKFASALQFLEQRVCAVFVADRVNSSFSVISRALGLPEYVVPESSLLPLNSFEIRIPEVTNVSLEAGVSRIARVWRLSDRLTGIFDAHNVLDNALFAAMSSRLENVLTAT
jgi:hypothetical protein